MNMLTKVLNRIYNEQYVTSITIINSGLTNLKPFLLLEGGPIVQNLLSIDLSNNQIGSAMEICLINLPLISEIKLGKLRVMQARTKYRIFGAFNDILGPNLNYWT